MVSAEQFISHLISLTRKEMEIDTAATKKLLSGSSMDLQKKGVAVLDLKVTDVKPGIACSFNIEFGVHHAPQEQQRKRKGAPNQSSTIPQHRLVRGDIVALQIYHRLNQVNDVPLDEFWTAIIVQVKKESITVHVDVDAEEKNSFLQLANFVGFIKIVKLPNNITHQRILTALTTLLAQHKKFSTPLNRILLDQQEPTGPICNDSVIFLDQKLNSFQKDAVKLSLSAPYIQLIHGPPGKTHTLVEIIRQLAAQKKTILVCGPSNVSVDNLLERVMDHKHIKSVRIGHPARVSPYVVGVTLDVLAATRSSSQQARDKFATKIKDNMQKLSVQLRKSSKVSEKHNMDATCNLLNKILKNKVKRGDVAEVIRGAQVIFSTLAGAGNRNIRHRTFDVVIIDESAQATEPECWIALSKARKAILAGDHLQLAPTVITPPSAKHGKKPIGMSLLTNLSYTLFDRLLDMYGDKIKQLLSIQYRMNKTIMQFSSDQLYGAKLIADESVADHTLVDLENILKNGSKNLNTPIITIDTSDTLTSFEIKGKGIDRSSTANAYEVEVIVQHIHKLISAGVKKHQMGVITPYKAQVARLRQAMGEKWIDIEVGTVDGFQGREKEVILLSLVRSNAAGQVGFLAEKRRLNVAMTRAKRNLVVVCNRVTLTKSVEENKSSIYYIDREFLKNWMVWLLTASDVRASMQIKLIKVY